MIKLPKSAKITNISFEIDDCDTGELDQFTRSCGLQPEKVEIDGNEYQLLEISFGTPQRLISYLKDEESKLIRKVDLKILACDSSRFL